MNKYQKREQLLHKIVATSGFLFALSILPIAQYLLTSNVAPASSGSVLGASTDQSITGSTQDTAAVASLNASQVASCQAQQQQDLANLNIFWQGKQAALLRTYQAAIQPYQTAEAELVGTPQKISQEKGALDQLINNQANVYASSLNQVQLAVTQAKTAIQSRNCSGTSNG